MVSKRIFISAGGVPPGHVMRTRIALLVPIISMPASGISLETFSLDAGKLPALPAMKRPEVSVATATILTYHRIVSDGAREFFHDIELTPFEQQLRRVLERTTAIEDGFRLLPGRGSVCLTFDDGTTDHREVAELLSSRGLKGTFFVITGRLDNAGYLSEDDVRSMAAQGHRLASHSVTHRHLTSLSAAELAEELINSRRHLEALTQSAVDWLAPPGGVYSKAVIEEAQRVGYKVVRTMDWGYAEFPLCGRVPCLPVIPRYNIAVFDRLLDGRAPLWVHSVKNLLKRGVGPGIYTRLRNFSDRLLLQ
jgi:peptidoglycan/xylan/chitin deacetylase (PgdA/CDA1 family)